jgi:hypothetical protein
MLRPLRLHIASVNTYILCFEPTQSNFLRLIELFLFVTGGSLEDTRMESGAHQGGAGGMPPGSLYNNAGGGAPRSNSSSSSASPPTSVQTSSVNAAAAAAMLVVPQPINASKMGQQQGSIVSANGGTGRKYQCKMCPQVGEHVLCKLSLSVWCSYVSCILIPHQTPGLQICMPLNALHPRS